MHWGLMRTRHKSPDMIREKKVGPQADEVMTGEPGGAEDRTQVKARVGRRWRSGPGRKKDQEGKRSGQQWGRR
jgi:hypothetical protein